MERCLNFTGTAGFPHSFHTHTHTHTKRARRRRTELPTDVPALESRMMLSAATLDVTTVLIGSGSTSSDSGGSATSSGSGDGSSQNLATSNYGSGAISLSPPSSGNGSTQTSATLGSGSVTSAYSGSGSGSGIGSGTGTGSGSGTGTGSGTGSGSGSGSGPGSITAADQFAETYPTVGIDIDLLFGSVDTVPGSLQAILISAPTQGAVSVAGGTAAYVPNVNATGSDTFTFELTNGTVCSAPATVNITLATVTMTLSDANAGGTFNESDADTETDSNPGANTVANIAADYGPGDISSIYTLSGSSTATDVKQMFGSITLQALSNSIHNSFETTTLTFGVYLPNGQQAGTATYNFGNNNYSGSLVFPQTITASQLNVGSNNVTGSLVSGTAERPLATDVIQVIQSNSNDSSTAYQILISKVTGPVTNMIDSQFSTVFKILDKGEQDAIGILGQAAGTQFNNTVISPVITQIQQMNADLDARAAKWAQMVFDNSGLDNYINFANGTVQQIQAQIATGLNSGFSGGSVTVTFNSPITTQLLPTIINLEQQVASNGIPSLGTAAQMFLSNTAALLNGSQATLVWNLPNNSQVFVTDTATVSVVGSRWSPGDNVSVYVRINLGNYGYLQLQLGDSFGKDQTNHFNYGFTSYITVINR